MYRHDTTDAPERQERTAKKTRDILDIVSEKRVSSLKAAEYMRKHINEDAYYRMLQCGDVLITLEDEPRETRRLKSAFFCGKRMCPGCQYRASMVTAAMISAISGALTSDSMVSIMVTLTAPNCEGEQLGDEIKRYNRAWNDLLKNEPYKSAWHDHIRKFEVTYNRKADTYHPHIHALVFVPQWYFKKTSGPGSYISQPRLLKDWRRVMKDPSITQVNIKRSYGESWKNISEMAKYVAKSSDYLVNQRVFDVFYLALKNKRLIGFSGRCKELRKEYKSGGLRQFVERDLTKYVWEVIYTDYSRTGSYVEETKRPCEGVIMNNVDIIVSAYMSSEWDELTV